MKVTTLQEKLLQAARNHPPGDHVPYAFEKRIMARLSALSLPDPLALWGRALWKAAAPCVAIMVIVGVWSLVTPSATPSSEVNLSAELEQAVYASLESQVGVSVNW